MQNLLNENGLVVSRITPESSESGPEARPLEIREWLRKCDETWSYVILEDDTIWNWGWLQRNVVNTQTYVGKDKYENDKYERGPTIMHAEKAIAILNDTSAMTRMV